MWSNLFIFHSNDQNRFQEESTDKTLFHFKTCMRSIYIGDKRISKNFSFRGYNTIFGYKAYKFILEIVCGMHSRLFGETEVMNQFKVQFDDKNLENSPFDSYLKKLKNHVMEDAKIIRSKYLQNRGEQSYGGLARKYTKKIKSITLIGTGQLTEKILPWVENKSIKIVGRNKERLSYLSKKFKITKVLSYKELDDHEDEAIIIAAPVPFDLKETNCPKLILDFRDQTYNESYPKSIDYVSLKDMFLQLSNTEKKNQKLRNQILDMMDSIIYTRRMETQMTVYCWEDICCCVA